MNDFKNRIRLNSTEDEIVNYYDKNGKKIGTVKREEGIEKSLLLKAVQIWIINPKTKQVLMQQRSHKKVNDPRNDRCKCFWPCENRGNPNASNYKRR